MNQSDLIKCFYEGADSGESGNAKIEDNQFIHFSTPILERYDNRIIFNVSMYSDQTRFLQRKIKKIISVEGLIEVKNVPWGYSGKLKNFIEDIK